MSKSDRVINYSLRPKKAVERKMLCDLIRGIQIALNANDLTYVGMGAKYFEDFLLFHNEFGMRKMISIEENIKARSRYEFNKPLKQIEMKYGKTTEVLPQLDLHKGMHVVWLDYDSRFNENMIEDMKILAQNMAKGSLFFLSCNCFFEGNGASERMSAFKKAIPNHISPDEKNQYTSNNIPLVIKHMIDANIRDALRVRNRSKEEKIEYLQLLYFFYRDGAPMLTVGGVLADEEEKTRILKTVSKSEFGFVKLNEDEEAFRIEVPSLTQKEIRHILQKLPLTEEDYEQSKDLFYGITYSEIEKFDKIHRYYPYYSEGRLHG
jgi:hypothetical protein